MARPPIRLRNSWKSSCPSESRSSFFIRRSRTPGSFWFFVKAPSSVFMRIRNLALESLLLLPSLPACFWKTAVRDSMHRSVSVGLDIFAMSERSEARDCEWGAARRAWLLYILNLNSKLPWHFFPFLTHPWHLKPILLGSGGRLCVCLFYVWNGLMIHKLFPFKLHLSVRKLVARQYVWRDSIWGEMLFA